MKKVLSLVLVFVMIFSAMVSAAEFDFIHRTDASRNYKLKEIFKKDGALKFVALNKADYFVEIGGKYYSYQEAIEVAETPAGKDLDITGMVEKNLLTVVEKPVATELKITEVVEINNYAVTVKYAKLADGINQADVEVVVKDGKGKEYELTLTALKAESEKATFVFKTALGAFPEGVWTVNGVKYDCDFAKNIADFVVAAPTDVNGIYDLLVKIGITGLVTDNIPKYAEEKSKLTSTTLNPTKEDIQKWVDSVNAGEVTTLAVKIKTVASASTVVNAKLIELLGAAKIERFNEKWIDQVATAIKNIPATDTVTIELIQKAVDSVNKDQLKVLATNLIGTSTATAKEVKELMKKFEDYGKKDKEFTHEELKENFEGLENKLLLIDVAGVNNVKAKAAFNELVKKSKALDAYKKLEEDDKTIVIEAVIGTNHNDLSSFEIAVDTVVTKIANVKKALAKVERGVVVLTQEYEYANIKGLLESFEETHSIAATALDATLKMNEAEFTYTNGKVDTDKFTTIKAIATALKLKSAKLK